MEHCQNKRKGKRKSRSTDNDAMKLQKEEAFEHKKLEAEPCFLIQRFQSWKVDPRVLKRVEDIVIYKFAKCITPVNLCHHLLGFMGRQYDAKESVFRFGSKTIGISLFDIYNMTGLPITGHAVFFEGDFGKLAELCQNYIGLTLSEETVNLLKLKEDYMCPSEDATDADLDKHARAYLFFILGCLFFSTSHKRSLSAKYFAPLCCNLLDINNYAWGAALLAYLHFSLARFAQTASKNASPSALIGCSIIVQMIAFYRLKKIAVEYFNNTSLPRSFPLIQCWSSMMRETKAHTKKLKVPLSVHLLSDENGEVMIDDSPYEVLPPSPEHDLMLLMCEVKVHLICMQTLWNYDPKKYAHENHCKINSKSGVRQLQLNHAKRSRKLVEDHKQVWDEVQSQLAIMSDNHMEDHGDHHHGDHDGTSYDDVEGDTRNTDVLMDNVAPIKEDGSVVVSNGSANENVVMDNNLETGNSCVANAVAMEILDTPINVFSKSVLDIHGNESDFGKNVTSNLQAHFEGVAQMNLEENELPLLNRTRANGENGCDSLEENNRSDAKVDVGVKSPEKRVKKVVFDLGNNLTWMTDNPLPSRNLRIPASATPRGSALKKGVPPGPIIEVTISPEKATRKKATRKKATRKKGRKIAGG